MEFIMHRLDRYLAIINECQPSSPVVMESTIHYKPEYTELRRAILGQNPEKVEELCEQGEDVNQLSLPKYKTPLAEAATKGNLEIVQILLHYNASPNTKCPMSDPPLICAAKKGHAEVVKVLLDHNAFEGLEPVNYVSALGFAVYKNKSAVVEHLLATGVDPNKKHFFKDTPLASALQKQSKKIVESLLASGASFDALDCVSGAAMDFIVRKNMLSTLKALVTSFNKRKESRNPLKVEWEISSDILWGVHNILHTAFRYKRTDIQLYLERT